MKKALLGIAAVTLLLLSASCAKKNVISGQFDGLASDSLLVEIMDFNNMREPLRSMVIPAPEGKFSFEVVDSVVRGILIYIPDDVRGKEHGITSVVFVPGERAKISGTLDSPVIDGSRFFKDQKVYEDLCKEDQDKIKGIIDEYRAAGSAGDEAKADSLMEAYKGINEHIASITKDFVKSNPSSVYAASILGNLIGDDGKDVLEVLELIPEKVKEGPVKPLVEKYKLSAEKAYARAEAAQKVKDNMNAPDFTLKNEKGADFTLSSIYNQGKYIILDFWGEWCYWCVKGIPDMKQLYKDAKGKIEIVSIDCRDTEEVWKKAIAEHGLPWLHVYNPEGPKDLSIVYAIQGYPTKIILNPDGSINKTIVGEDPEFYSYVRNLIGIK